MNKTLIGIGLLIVLLLSACSSSSETEPEKPIKKQAEGAEPAKPAKEQKEETQPAGDGSTKLLLTIERPEKEDHWIDIYDMKGEKIFFKSRMGDYSQEHVIDSEGKLISSSDFTHANPDKSDCNQGISSPDGRYWAFSCKEDKAAFSIYDFKKGEVVYQHKKGIGKFKMDTIKMAEHFAISNKGEVFVGLHKLIYIINSKDGKAKVLDLTKLDTENGINEIYIDDSSENLILETDDQIYSYNRETKEAEPVVKTSRDEETRVEIIGVSPNGKYMVYQKETEKKGQGTIATYVFKNLKTSKETESAMILRPDSPDNNGYFPWCRGYDDKAYLIHFETDEIRKFPIDPKTIVLEPFKLKLSSDGKYATYYTKTNEKGKDRFSFYRIALKDIESYEKVPDTKNWAEQDWTSY